MSNETTNSTVIPITADTLAHLDALPQPAVTEPCPSWCTTGPHEADMPVSGTQANPEGMFNHDHYFIKEDGVQVSVCQNEVIDNSGTSRSAVDLFVYLEETNAPFKSLEQAQRFAVALNGALTMLDEIKMAAMLASR